MYNGSFWTVIKIGELGLFRGNMPGVRRPYVLWERSESEPRGDPMTMAEADRWLELETDLPWSTRCRMLLEAETWAAIEELECRWSPAPVPESVSTTAVDGQ